MHFHSRPVLPFSYLQQICSKLFNYIFHCRTSQSRLFHFENWTITFLVQQEGWLNVMSKWQTMQISGEKPHQETSESALYAKVWNCLWQRKDLNSCKQFRNSRKWKYFFFYWIHDEQFLILTQCFQKWAVAYASESVCSWERVKVLLIDYWKPSGGAFR